MKTFKLLLIVILSIIIAMFATACLDTSDSTSDGTSASVSDSQGSTSEQPQEKVLDSIYVDKLPTLLYYGLNEQPMWQGIRIMARYSDNTTEIIPFADCTFSTVDTATYGAKTVTISYQGKTTEFNIFVTESIEFVPNTETEALYLYENYSGVGDIGDRFADENNYFVYKFTAGEGKRFADVNVEMTIRNEYVVAVSFDNENWTVVAEGATGADRIDFTDIELSLSDYIAFEDNTGRLYFKFYDGVPSDGFGASLSAFAMHYLTADYEGVSEDKTEEVVVEFGACSDLEALYIYENVGTGTIVEEGHTRRWADNSSYIIYKFALGKEIKAAKLDLGIENETKIEVSFDGVVWVEFANSITENANNCGRYFGNVTNTFTVPVTANTGVMYIKFSDANTADGFGCCLHNVKVTATVVAAVGAKTQTISFAAASAEEAGYISSESATGTVENTKRWADKNAYFVYKFAFAGEITAAELALVIENQAKIEVSFDGQTWITLGDSIAENANDCGKYFSNITTSFEVSVTENTGVIYVRFSDADITDGFGCCLYNFGITVTY